MSFAGDTNKENKMELEKALKEVQEWLHNRGSLSSHEAVTTLFTDVLLRLGLDPTHRAFVENQLSWNGFKFYNRQEAQKCLDLWVKLTTEPEIITCLRQRVTEEDSITTFAEDCAFWKEILSYPAVVNHLIKVRSDILARYLSGSQVLDNDKIQELLAVYDLYAYKNKNKEKLDRIQQLEEELAQLKSELE